MSMVKTDFAKLLHSEEKPMQRATMILLMSNELLGTTGKRIRALAEDRGISLRELALQLDDMAKKKNRGMTQSFLSQILRGKKPPLEVVIDLAIILNTTTDYLLLLTDNHNRPSQIDDAPPHYFSPEADNVARIVDDLPPWERVRLEYMARASSEYVAEAHKRAELTAKDIQTALQFHGLTISDAAVRSIATVLDGAWTGDGRSDK